MHDLSLRGYGFKRACVLVYSWINLFVSIGDMIDWVLTILALVYLCLMLNWIVEADE